MLPGDSCSYQMIYRRIRAPKGIVSGSFPLPRHGLLQARKSGQNQTVSARPRRTLAAVALAGLLLASFLMPIGLGDEGRDDDGDNPGSGHRSDGGGRDNSDDQAADDEDEEKDRQGRRNHGESEPRQPGRIEEAAGAFDGRYVDFRFNTTSCTVSDYRLYNVTFFDSITLGGTCESAPKAGGQHGHEVRVASDSAELRLHDAPNGLIRFKAEGATVDFDWADALTAAQNSKGVELATGANLTGQLRVDVDDTPNITIGSGSLQAMNASGGFWAHPLSGGSPERIEIRDAIKKGHVAGEIDVLLADGAISTEVLQYEDVLIKVGKKNASGFRVLVDGNLTEGRVFVVNVGPGLFEQEKIGVRYYDEDADGLLEETSIAMADNLADAISIEPGEGPEYWVTHDQTGKHVVVTVPSFSVHAFEVMGLSATVVPSILAGAALGIGLVAAAGVGIVPRRHLQ